MNKWDYVELITENEEYARDGVHKGMQGQICYSACIRTYWLVRFPQCAGSPDITIVGVKEADLKQIPALDPRVNERLRVQHEEADAQYRQQQAGKKVAMKEMDCVKLIVEKERYIEDGVHKGMYGWICYPECSGGYWLVNFTQCGEKDDIATISVKEEDMEIVPIMYAIVNEWLKAQFDAGEIAPLQTPEEVFISDD